jgi:hypothetical protein
MCTPSLFEKNLKEKHIFLLLPLYIQPQCVCVYSWRASREEEVYQQQPTTGFLLLPLGQVNGHQPLHCCCYLLVIVVFTTFLFFRFFFFLSKKKNRRGGFWVIFCRRDTNVL